MAVTRQERVELALAALQEVTDAGDIGEVLAVEEVEPGVVDVRFASTTAAYAGWHWTVSTADLPDQEPTVLEVELLPGDGALLAPPWVPWAERLAEGRRQHPDERHPGEPGDDEADLDEAGDDLDDDLDEDTDLDEDDLSGDDGLDELDDADLEGEESPEEAEQDSGDVTDEDDDEPDHEPDEDDSDDDDGRVRPALEDRSL